MIRRFHIIVSCLFIMQAIAFDASAMEIISPTEGQRIEIGTMLRIVIKAQPGENIVKVIIALAEIPYDATQGAFVKEGVIPTDAIPGEIILEAQALTSTNQIITVGPRTFFTVLPASVVLKAIKIPDYQKTLFFSWFGQVLHIYAEGEYSDAITRPIDEAGSGTTFVSSNTNIATVSTTGDVTSIANGTAEITISNGGKKVKVPVVVKVKP